LIAFAGAQEKSIGAKTAGVNAVDAEAIDAYVRSIMEREHVPGLSVAVVKDGQLVFAQGYGLANVELDVPATADTVYEVLSVSKQFTATAIVMLAEEKKLALDDAIAKHLAALPDEWSGITIRHLLTHTSGIKDYTDADGWLEKIRLDRTPEELLKPVMEAPLLFAPGERWSYSNSNYYLLGMILEKISGKTYAEFLAERIFKPLAMTSTRIDDYRDIIKRRASGYHWQKDELGNAAYVSPTQKWSAGAVVSTVNDMAKWEAAIASAKLVPAETQRAMFSPAHLSSGAEVKYGLGNELDDDHGHRVAGHQGGGLAFNATDLRFVDDNLAVIVLCNLTQAPSRVIARHIAAFYVPDISDEGKAGIEDKDPAATSMLRQVLLDAAQGKCDPARFAAGVDDKMVPFIKRAGPQFLGTLGKLEDFTLLQADNKAKQRTLRYRARFEKSSIIWTFELDAARKILSMEPTRE
jgi:CubicO group peptidase (beta-lactamase class C family)